MTSRKIQLTQEEKAIDEAFARGEYKSVPKKEWGKYIQAAKAFKDTRITIRLNGADVSKIKRKAEHEGLRYQTLIGSLLHKYAQAL